VEVLHEGGFSEEKIARDGWLGICIHEEYGGAGLGITEGAIMMQAIAESSRPARACTTDGVTR
jgi:acyl-CoA dehydrogenase